MADKKKQIGALLLATILVVTDQLVKFWTRANIPLGATQEFLPGVVELTYYQNTGAAFSMLREHTWLLAIISAVASVVLVVMIWRDTYPHPVASLSLSFVLGGAVGNLIDRALLGYVVDMFYLTFMNFAIFNVADIAVSIGAVLLVVYVLFFYKEEKKL